MEGTRCVRYEGEINREYGQVWPSKSGMFQCLLVLGSLAHYIATQCSVFRSWQGWLAMSNTGPGEGTLRLFPDILLSNAYLLLRPFFSPIRTLPDFLVEFGPQKEEEARLAFLAAENWRFDNSLPNFPGIKSLEGGRMFSGQRLSPHSHPHLRLDRESTMIGVPRVQPGDLVFWHCGRDCLACFSPFMEG